MWPDVPFFPEQASEVARSVDHLFFFALAVLVAFSSLIAVLILLFAVRYRRRSPDEIGVDVYATSLLAKRLEIAWSTIPLAILLFLFVWGTKVFFAQNRPPADAVEFSVTAKQWMWKIQHPEGKREINELHVPVHTPVRLRMISEDVIHSFFVPAFRVHVDVLPSRYTTYWFNANKTGKFHLFCGEYCGVEHSRMVGSVEVMKAHEYQDWLAGKAAVRGAQISGEGLFRTKGCTTCHRSDSAARAPILNGLWGRPVTLSDGAVVVADDDYVRESILRPAAKVVAGFEPKMPPFQGQISEEDLVLLLNYLRSLAAPGRGEMR